MIRFIIFNLCLFVVNILPVKWSYWLADRLADVFRRCVPQDQKIIQRNLMIVNKELDHNQEAKDAIRHFARYFLEFLLMPRLVREKKHQFRFDLTQISIIKQYAQKHQGAIVITGHLGNWELGAALLTQNGCPMSAVALSHKSKWTNKFFIRRRELCGVHVIDMEKAVKECLRTLRQNHLVAIVGDRDFTQTGVTVEMFGRPTVLPRGAALFAERANVPLIPSFLVRTKPGYFVLRVYPPIIPDNFRSKSGTSDSEGVIRVLVQEYAKVLEKEIFQNPSQWMVFQEFWK